MLHVKEIYESSERWREDERLVRTPAPINNRTVFSLSPPPPILICFGFDSYTVVLEPKKKKNGNLEIPKGSDTKKPQQKPPFCRQRARKGKLNKTENHNSYITTAKHQPYPCQQMDASEKPRFPASSGHKESPQSALQCCQRWLNKQLGLSSLMNDREHSPQQWVNG